MAKEEKYPWYQALYHNFCIGICNDERLLRIYCEEHRGLKPNEYHVSGMYFIPIKQENQVLEKFYDMYLPKRDIIFIMNDSKYDSNVLLKQTILQLGMAENVLYGIGRKKDSYKIHDAIDTLEKYNNEVDGKFEEGYRMLHPLVFMDITEYLYQLRTYEEMYHLDSEFKRKMMEDD